MKKSFKKVILLCILSICIFSCSKDGETTPAADDFVKDAASLMRKITISGATIKNGEIPVPPGPHSDNIVSMPNTVIVTSNSLFAMPITTNITDGRIPRMVFIKLEGSDQYYQIDLDSNGQPIANRNMTLASRLNCSGHPDIRLEANGVDVPSYINAAEVYTYAPPLQSDPLDPSFFQNAQYWSSGHGIDFKALDVGTGDVQVSLTWDTQSDVDLWLTEPNGNKIYYANKVSSTGGELDFDNTTAYGPENIFYQNVAPSGSYNVQVHYYSGSAFPTNYNIVVKNGSSIVSYSGTLTADDQVDTVVLFTK